ncbi:MAG: SgcJ/EcaC family oxidoreductase [Brevundimonas sp.]|uniref:SgcJ/EcaC family oxidoreductase n=1 Tax=Brevundimonas sp. TaxID=1871086 RepID=UPI00391D0667
MNRRTLMTILAGASLMTAVPAQGHTQVADADRAAVQAWLEECTAAWATSDAERMFRMASDDVEWVNIVGMHWRGKAQVVSVHHLYLTTMFKGVPMSLKSIESIRAVSSDVVIAVVRWSVGQFSPPDGSIVPASDDRMTLVFRRTSAGLQLVHGANVQINAVAEQFDPSRGPPPSN